MPTSRPRSILGCYNHNPIQLFCDDVNFDKRADIDIARAPNCWFVERCSAACQANVV